MQRLYKIGAVSLLSWIGFVILPGLWAVVGVWFATDAVREITTTNLTRHGS